MKQFAALQADKTLPLRDKGTAVAALPVQNGKTFGWKRDDETLTFSFLPRGHASVFLTSWLDTLSTSPRLSSSEDVRSAFQQLTSSTSKGLCATCHTVDSLDDGTSVVNWRAKGSETEASGFTRFSHDPHVILPQLRDCTACHQVNAEAATVATDLQTDPLAFQPGFHPMTKQACATCHAPKLAGDQCTTCHNYHVGAGVPSGELSVSSDSPNQVE